jgi:hypothetical protein
LDSKEIHCLALGTTQTISELQSSIKTIEKWMTVLNINLGDSLDKVARSLKAEIDTKCDKTDVENKMNLLEK